MDTYRKIITNLIKIGKQEFLDHKWLDDYTMELLIKNILHENGFS